MRSRPALIAALAAFFALAAPAAAGASVAEVTEAGELLVNAQPGEENQIEIRYRTADEAGFNGVSDRIVVSDEVLQAPVGTDCVAISTGSISCDARRVKTIRALLSDGNDVLVVNAGKADGVPASLPFSAAGGPGNDVIRGGLGDDFISGDAGNDIAAGWIGDDDLRGGSGSDGLIGFAGDDDLLGGAGSDALFGQKGRDAMRGEAGNDVLLAKDGIKDRRIDCGAGGLERAVTDEFDPKAVSCPAPKAKKKRKS